MEKKTTKKKYGSDYHRTHYLKNRTAILLRRKRDYENKKTERKGEKNDRIDYNTNSDIINNNRS